MKKLSSGAPPLAPPPPRAPGGLSTERGAGEAVPEGGPMRSLVPISSGRVSSGANALMESEWMSSISSPSAACTSFWRLILETPLKHKNKR